MLGREGDTMLAKLQVTKSLNVDFIGPRYLKMLMNFILDVELVRHP